MPKKNIEHNLNRIPLSFDIVKQNSIDGLLIILFLQNIKYVCFLLKFISEEFYKTTPVKSHESELKGLILLLL